MTYLELAENRGDGAGDALSRAESGVKALEERLGARMPVAEFCRRMGIEFDERGRIADMEMPREMERIGWLHVEDENLGNDVHAALARREIPGKTSRRTVEEVKMEYRRAEDCNVAYNDAIEAAIDRVLGREMF